MVMKLLGCAVLHTALSSGVLTPSCQYTKEEFGNPCYKGDLVFANRNIDYPEGVSVTKGGRGEIADNLGAHGPGPLNVKWEEDNREIKTPLWVTYEDLTDESCVVCDAGVPLQGGGACVGAPPGGPHNCQGFPVCKENKKKCGPGKGGCVGKPEGAVVNGKICRGDAVLKCCNKKCVGFAKDEGASRRWPRYSAYDEFNYPRPR